VDGLKACDFAARNGHKRVADILMSVDRQR
jgi:hypothetical protein